MINEDGIRISTICISTEGKLTSLSIDPSQSAHQLQGFLGLLQDRKLAPLDELISYYTLYIDESRAVRISIAALIRTDGTREFLKFRLGPEEAKILADILCGIGLENIIVGHYAKAYRDGSFVDYTEQIKHFLGLFAQQYH